MIVQVNLRTVGMHFATVAEIRDMNGHLLATTRERPYGFSGACRGDARGLAEKRRWVVK